MRTTSRKYLRVSKTANFTVLTVFNNRAVASNPNKDRPIITAAGEPARISHINPAYAYVQEIKIASPKVSGRFGRSPLSDSSLLVCISLAHINLCRSDPVACGPGCDRRFVPHTFLPEVSQGAFADFKNRMVADHAGRGAGLGSSLSGHDKANVEMALPAYRFEHGRDCSPGRRFCCQAHIAQGQAAAGNCAPGCCFCVGGARGWASICRTGPARRTLACEPCNSQPGDSSREHE